MSANDEVRTLLIEMGVEPRKAHAAALRFGTADAAINWVFGEGENWTPDAEPPPVPAHPNSSYMDVWDGSAPPPPSPPTPVGGGPTSAFDELGGGGSAVPFASNNPFRSAAPLLPARRPKQDPDEENLQRMLELSKQTADAAAVGGAGAQGYAGDAGRAERERSVRASAPPPSPSPGDGSGPVFGPSNRTDPTSELAVVPRQSTLSTPIEIGQNMEEEDLQRAIQESMMMASFHSAGSQQENIPPQHPREPGAPVVYFALQQPTFAAHILQALAAVPQLTDVFANLPAEHDDPEPLVVLREAFSRQYEDYNYTLIDEHIDALHRAWEITSTALPPHAAIIDKWIPQLHHQLMSAASGHSSLVCVDEKLPDFYANPSQLLTTLLRSVPIVPQFNVTFDRLIWSPENPDESIEQLADVVFVNLRRQPGVATTKWELDDRIVLDRYLTHNAVWAAQVRAKQAVIQGELRRCRDQIERLTTFKDHSLPDAIQTLIKHLDTVPSGEHDDRADDRAELKGKLERIQGLLRAKVAKLEETIAEHVGEASGALFDNPDPSKQQNEYLLRAVLWHDGFLTPGKHLYAYVRGEDSWWKVQDTASKVEWKDIQDDMCGLFTDGGPYLLVYSRSGPRPVDAASEASAGPSDLLDIDMAHADNGADAIDARRATAGSASAAGSMSWQEALAAAAATLEAHTGSDAAPGPTAPGAEGPSAAPASVMATAAATPVPPRAVSRSRPPSPVKGSVKGPRPLPSASRKSSVVDTLSSAHDEAVRTHRSAPAPAASATPTPEYLLDPDGDAVMKDS